MVVGRTVEELDTPALVVDLDAMERNIRHMVARCREFGVDWRPHSKANKCPAIARKEIEAGAIGVTCAKLGEAEVMAAGGVRDILIANQIAGPEKVRRLVELCRHAEPIVAIDDRAQIDPMSEAAAAAGVTVRAIVEVNVGLDRAGTAPGAPSVELARHIHSLPGVKLEGIMGYEGHLLALPDPEEKERKIREAMAVLVSTRDDLLEAGLPCPIVSAGGTGSLFITASCPGVTELQAGGLIFMDNFYRTQCRIEEFEFAMRLVTTVVSRPAPERAIVDAGRKSHYADHAQPTVIGREDVVFERYSAEHGQFRVGPSAQDLKVGDRLELIPGYTDFTTVLHDEFYGVRNGRVEEVLRLEGRGKIR